MVEWQLGHHSC